MADDKDCGKCEDKGIKVQHGSKLPCPQDDKAAYPKSSKGK